MRGEVLSFDETTGEGSIVGEDGARYQFRRDDIRRTSNLDPGQKVEFAQAADRQAHEVTAIYPEIVTERMSRGHFDLGRVIQRTFNSIGQNAAVFFGASIVLVGVPSTLTVIGQSSMLTGASSSSLAFMALGTVLNFIGAYLLQGMVVKAAVNSFHGKKTAFGDAFSAGVHMMLPLVGLAIIASLAIGLGYVFLIVPGLILTVIWSVAAPAVVVEKRGVFESLQRSRDLTRGNRWQVFGLLVIYFVLALVIGVAISGVSVAAGGTIDGNSPNLLVNLISGPVVNVLSGVIAAAGVSALYYELRAAKEGVGAEDLISVFD